MFLYILIHTIYNMYILCVHMTFIYGAFYYLMFSVFDGINLQMDFEIV